MVSTTIEPTKLRPQNPQGLRSVATHCSKCPKCPKGALRGQNGPKTGGNDLQQCQTLLWFMPTSKNARPVTNSALMKRFGPWKTNLEAFYGPQGAVVGRFANPNHIEVHFSRVQSAPQGWPKHTPRPEFESLAAPLAPIWAWKARLGQDRNYQIFIFPCGCKKGKLIEIRAKVANFGCWGPLPEAF